MDDKLKGMIEDCGLEAGDVWHVIEAAKKLAVESALAEVWGGFSVVAGKYDDNELNCKYSAEHDTLSAAIEDYDKVSSYPWAFIEFNGRVLDVWAKDNHPFRGRL